MKKLFSLALAFGLLIGATGCASDGDAKDEKKEEKKKTSFEIGETVESGDLKITVNSVRNSEGGTISKPDEGTIFFVMDITIENTGDEDESMSSLLNFKLVDGDGRDQDLEIFADNNGSMDGDVPAGEKLTGEIAYQVSPEGKLVLRFKKDLIGGKDIPINVR